MIRVLEIVAQSWPIAIMTLGFIAGGLALYVIRWWKKSDAEDKAYRASNAVTVRDRDY